MMVLRKETVRLEDQSFEECIFESFQKRERRSVSETSGIGIALVISMRVEFYKLGVQVQPPTLLPNGGMPQAAACTSL